MIILGIDPGTTLIGYSVIDASEREPRLLDAGLLCVGAPSTDQRLKEIHEEILRIIRLWNPSDMSVEKLYFATNLKTAMAVSEARGVILLTAALAGLKVYEYSPLAIKKMITGDGKADKRAVEKMLRMTIPEAAKLKARDDVFDAIAAALTCCYLEKNKQKAVVRVQGVTPYPADLR